MTKLSTFFTILIGTSLLLSSCAKQPAQPSRWHESKITIDGKLSEWEKPLLKPDKQTDIQCAVANDRQFLYLAIRIPDQRIQALTYQLGLTVWLDTLARRKEHLGVGFPLPLETTQMDHLGSVYAKKGQRAMEEAYAEMSQEFELIGLVEERLRISNLASKSMKVGANFDELGALTLEYKIPFKQLFKYIPSLDKEFGVAIKVNDPEQTADDDPGIFDDPSNNNPITQSNANPMMRGNGMGMGMGMPGRAGNNANLQQQMNRTPSMPNIWLKMKLSDGKTPKTD